MSFEVRFFGPASIPPGKAGPHRQCMFCQEWVCDHQKRRRNHLKQASAGSSCATNFRAGNKGLTFREFVLATGDGTLIKQLYPNEPPPALRYAGPMSPPGLSTSASLCASGDPGLGGSAGAGGSGAGPSVLGGGSGAAAATPPFFSDPESGRPGAAPSRPPSRASGYFTPGNVLHPPCARDIQEFKMQLTRVMCACGYSAHSLQHDEWISLVAILRPGMEVHLPGERQIM